MLHPRLFTKCLGRADEFNFDACVFCCLFDRLANTITEGFGKVGIVSEQDIVAK